MSTREPYLTPVQADDAGQVIRTAWMEWARTQPSPKPSWLVPWDQLSEADRDADRHIAEVLLSWWDCQ